MTVRVLRRALLLLGIVLTATCGGGDSAAPPEPIASVELSASTVSLAPGATAQLTATARSAAGTALTGRTFSWAMVQPTIATVSAAGLITGVSDGTTTVTVTSEGKSAAATVTVRTPVATVVVTPATAQLTVGGTPSQLAASTRDATGATLAGRAITWSSSSVASATVSQTGLVTAVDAGTTTITATSEGRSGTAVITTLQDPCKVVRTITIGQTANSTMSSGDCKFTDNTAFQAYSLTVTTSTLLEIEMSSTVVDPYLLVYDASNKLIAEDDDGGIGTTARVLRTFAPGVYLVMANTYDANSFGTYQLAVRNAPAACSSSRPTTLPASINAVMNATNSCRLNDHTFLDRYDVTLTASTKLRIDMTSTEVDSYLFLLDDKGNPVAQDDDSGPGINAHIEIGLAAGHYTVLANALPNQTGAYRLDMVLVVDPCTVARLINIGQAFSSTLTTADCSVGSEGPLPYTQRWVVTVPTSSALQIDMTSATLDTYLVVQSFSTGAILFENDDAVPGVNSNARVVGVFPAGQYIINATTYDGAVGAYTLAIATIAPLTPVTITLQATLALTAGQQQTLTPTITGTTNTAVTWSSSAPDIATVTTAGLIRGVTPGNATITARSAADPNKTATIAVTVTQSQTGNPNLDISAMYLIQSVQTLDGSVKLVANRDAVARVYLRASRLGLGVVSVRVRVYQGATLLQTFQSSGTPTLTADESCCSANITIPASLIRTGVSILADIDPQNTVAESNESDNNFPLSGTPMALNVATVPDLNVTLVPIRQNRSGQVGVASATLPNVLKSIWPLATVTLRTRATPLVVDYTIVTQSFDEWEYLVRDLELARRADPLAQYYYGLIRVNYTSGVDGMAQGIPALSAVGVDEGSSFGPTESRNVMAHEMGHAFGLRHAPCGGAGGPDPAYPFPDGRTGAYGLDIASGGLLKLPTGTDIMGYCDNSWVSVYNYRNVFDQRARNPNGVPASIATPAAATSVLMFTGGVSANDAQIDGSFAMNASPTKDDPSGRFVIEGFAANGKVLFSHRFSPFVVYDGRPGDEAFVIGVAVNEAITAQTVRVAVREVGGARSGMREKTLSAESLNARRSLLTTSRTTSGAMSLNWSTSASPMVMVRNPLTGEVIGIGRRGNLDLEQFTGLTNIDVLVSDGVSSVLRSVNTQTGAIRQ